jgi:hypothetical protein
MAIFATPVRLCERLRRPPSPSSVPGSLPVLFFGDLFTAQAATVGINPSQREYLDRMGVELQGPGRRFETLSSLGASDRASLTDAQCHRAVTTMRCYFHPGKPVFKWFIPLQRVLRGMGLGYRHGDVTHLDLVQESTNPTWSELQRVQRAEAQALRRQDEAFLRWQLEAYPLREIICNGLTPLHEVQRLLGSTATRSGTLARVTWHVGTATIAGRRVGIAGWNIPLTRPTGLGRHDHTELGRTLRAALKEVMAE